MPGYPNTQTANPVPKEQPKSEEKEFNPIEAMKELQRGYKKVEDLVNSVEQASYFLKKYQSLATKVVDSIKTQQEKLKSMLS